MRLHKCGDAICPALATSFHFVCIAFYTSSLSWIFQSALYQSRLVKQGFLVAAGYTWDTRSIWLSASLITPLIYFFSSYHFQDERYYTGYI